MADPDSEWGPRVARSDDSGGLPVVWAFGCVREWRALLLVVWACHLGFGVMFSGGWLGMAERTRIWSVVPRGAGVRSA